MDHKWLCDKYLDRPGFNGVWEDEKGFVLSYNEHCPLKTRAWLRVRKYAGMWPVKLQKEPEFEAFVSRLDKHRPAVGGISIGHKDITTGTLGGFVKFGEHVYAMSNNHVLANSNDAVMGDEILQPGPHDGGELPDDQYGVLSKYIVPINFEGGTNFVDLALAGPLGASQYTREIMEVERYPTAWRDIGLNWEVYKSGRTTGLTEGTVTGTNATVNVSYGDGKTARFAEQFIVQGKVKEPEPCTCGNIFGFSLCGLCRFLPLGCCGGSGEREQFSAGGDSGSWVLTEDRGETKFTMFLFAGSDTRTIMNPPRRVFESFEGMQLL